MIKIGDKLKTNYPSSRFHGLVGVVVEVLKEDGNPRYVLEYGGSGLRRKTPRNYTKKQIEEWRTYE